MCSKTKQRIIPIDAVKYWKEKIESMTNDVNEILKEEQMEKQVQNTFENLFGFFRKFSTKTLKNINEKQTVN
jgi:hypothetical protein